MQPRFSVLAAISALALSSTPLMAQTGGAATTQPAPDQNVQQAPGAAAQGSDSMREMMRQMMQEMIQQEPQIRGKREDRVERRGDRRWRDAGRMERRGMMRGPHHDGMRRGMMHGAGMRMMFAIVDADSNGALSLPEIQDFHGRIFNAVDENGDGSVEMEEIEAFFHGSAERGED